MNIETLLKEYNFEIDDIRWHLSMQYAMKLKGYKKSIYELGEYICSKRLEDDLYDMEEKFLTELQDKIDKNQIDESRVREILTQILINKENRYTE